MVTWATGMRLWSELKAHQAHMEMIADDEPGQQLNVAGGEVGDSGMMESWNLYSKPRWPNSLFQDGHWTRPQ